MKQQTIDMNAFDTLEEMSGYARPVEDFGDSQQLSRDHLGNLEIILEMLVRRRRYFALDATTYRATYSGRAKDIAGIQTVIEGVRAAIEDERAANPDQDDNAPGALR